MPKFSRNCVVAYTLRLSERHGTRLLYDAIKPPGLLSARAFTEHSSRLFNYFLQQKQCLAPKLFNLEYSSWASYFPSVPLDSFIFPNVD
jgi:hypothetical protein